jgi:thiol-disulfide isomerase/thioredoxin
MKKNIIQGFIIAFITIILIKFNPFSTKQKDEDASNTKLTLYDINFVKEQSALSLPSYQLTRHGKKTETFKLADLKGKPIILHFWDDGCGPCKKELPEFNEFVKSHPEIESIALMISESSKEKTQLLLNTYRASDVPVITDEKTKMAAFFDVSVIPTTVFINKLGNVVGSVTGTIDWKDEKVVELIINLLA